MRPLRTPGWEEGRSLGNLSLGAALGMEGGDGLVSRHKVPCRRIVQGVHIPFDLPGKMLFEGAHRSRVLIGHGSS